MIALLILAVLFAGQAVLFERERNGWRKERTFLTNAAIARSQTDFVVRQAAATRHEAPAPRPPVVASLDDIPEDARNAPNRLPFGL